MIDAVSSKSGLSKKDAASAVTAFVSTVTEQLKGGQEVRVQGLGAFTSKHKAERQGRNVRTGETITIAAKNAAAFKATKPLVDAMNGMHAKAAAASILRTLRTVG
jgi:DNA-binding protein HU-beta